MLQGWGEAMHAFFPCCEKLLQAKVLGLGPDMTKDLPFPVRSTPSTADGSICNRESQFTWCINICQGQLSSARRVYIEHCWLNSALTYREEHGRSGLPFAFPGSRLLCLQMIFLRKPSLPVLSPRSHLSCQPPTSSLEGMTLATCSEADSLHLCMDHQAYCGPTRVRPGPIG